MSNKYSGTNGTSGVAGVSGHRGSQGTAGPSSVPGAVGPDGKPVMPVFGTQGTSERPLPPGMVPPGQAPLPKPAVPGTDPNVKQPTEAERKLTEQRWAVLQGLRPSLDNMLDWINRHPETREWAAAAVAKTFALGRPPRQDELDLV